MNTRLKIAVAGAGLIGKRHIDAIQRVASVDLGAIVDPDPALAGLAGDLQVPWFDTLQALFAETRPDGIILATPNRLHVEQGLRCVDAACPMLIEKPIATEAAEASRLIDAAERAQVPILVGHHRRHNPLVALARALIEAGELGQIRSVHLQCWLYKPDDYFDAAPWRKQTGAGPIAVNIIHDVDLIRYLCGEIVEVQAQTAKAVRGFENEDVAVALLRFANGALGTLTLSDSIVAPWSWEMTTGENPMYPQTTESCYLIGGSDASLALPGLRLWRHRPPKGWTRPLDAADFEVDNSDPLDHQIEHFAEVIRGKAVPLVSGAEAARSLAVIEAIGEAARRGEAVTLD